ncbi:hypothetical protein EV714DRAFT_235478 [Schizophyllum commune]
MRFRRRKRRFYSWLVGTNLAVTRSLLAPVTRPTNLVLPDDNGLSGLCPRAISKATCSSRTPSGLHSRPFAPTYDSLLALDHDGDGDDDHDDHDDEGEHRAWPARAEETAGSVWRARRVEVDESEFSYFPALRLLIVRSDTDDDQWCPCPMRLTMPSRAIPGAKIESSWRLLGDSVTRRADLDVYMRRSRALVNTDGRARRDGGLCGRKHHAIQKYLCRRFPARGRWGCDSSRIWRGERNHRLPLEIGGAPDLSEKGGGGSTRALQKGRSLVMEYGQADSPPSSSSGGGPIGLRGAESRQFEREE